MHLLRRLAWPPGPYAPFTELPAVPLACDGLCRSRTPHRVDGPAARCVPCGTHRAVSPRQLEVRRA